MAAAKGPSCCQRTLHSVVRCGSTQAQSPAGSLAHNFGKAVKWLYNHLWVPIARTTLIRNFLQIRVVDFALYVLRIIMSYPLFLIVGDHAPLRHLATNVWKDPRIVMFNKRN